MARVPLKTFKCGRANRCKEQIFGFFQVLDRLFTAWGEVLRQYDNPDTLMSRAIGNGPPELQWLNANVLALLFSETKSSYI